MLKSEIFFKSLTWPVALLLTALVAGCWASGGSATTTSGGTTTAGAGTGLNGAGKGPAPVNLGGAGNYAILANTAITNPGSTAITGDMGLSPAAAIYITGFGLILDSTSCFSTSTQVTGKVYAADYSTGFCTTHSTLATAVNNMLTAYTDAAGRAPDYTELGAGNISGMTLAPATYKWSSGVLITSNVTLYGGPNDVWIFEIAQDVNMYNGVNVVLAGGALPKNIFWQVGGGTGVVLGSAAHMEGVVMAAKAITLNTGATANSRLLAQSAVTLNANTIAQPAP
jgi:Ice-binding-like